MYKIYFVLTVSILLLLYIISIIKITKNAKHLYFIIFFILIGVPIIYDNIGNLKALDALSLPKIQGQIRDNEKLRPLIASVERRTAKMGMLCDIEPQNVDNWWQYGQLLELQQRANDALQIYIKSFDIHKTAIPILERIVLLSLKLNDGVANSLVEKYSKKIIDLDPENIVAKHTNALFLYQRGDFLNAAKLWKNILVSIEDNSSYSSVKNDIKGMIELASKLDKEPNIYLKFGLSSMTSSDYLFVSLKQQDALFSPPLLAYRSRVEELPRNLRLSSLYALNHSFKWDDFKDKVLILEAFLSEQDIIDGSAKKILRKEIKLTYPLKPISYLVDSTERIIN